MVKQVNGKPEIKVIDFGIAKKLMEERNFLTETFAGSSLTMAPQVYESAVGYGIECDVYSLGCLIYYSIYNKYPYEPQY